jgi:hypothetical protein
MSVDWKSRHDVAAKRCIRLQKRNNSGYLIPSSYCFHGRHIEKACQVSAAHWYRLHAWLTDGRGFPMQIGWQSLFSLYSGTDRSANDQHLQLMTLAWYCLFVEENLPVRISYIVDPALPLLLPIISYQCHDSHADVR